MFTWAAMEVLSMKRADGKAYLLQKYNRVGIRSKGQGTLLLVYANVKNKHDIEGGMIPIGVICLLNKFHLVVVYVFLYTASRRNYIQKQLNLWGYIIDN